MGVTWQISLNSSCCLECRLLYLTLFHLVLRLQYYSMRRVLCDMHNSWEIGRPSGNTGSWDKKHLNNRTYWGLCGAEPRDWLGRICLKWILSKIWNINMVLREMYWDRYTFKACDYDTTLTVYRHWWKLLDKKWQLIKTKHTYKLCPSVCPSVLNCLSTCVSVCVQALSRPYVRADNRAMLTALNDSLLREFIKLLSRLKLSTSTTSDISLPTTNISMAATDVSMLSDASCMLVLSQILCSFSHELSYVLSCQRDSSNQLRDKLLISLPYLADVCRLLLNSDNVSYYQPLVTQVERKCVKQ